MKKFFLMTVVALLACISTTAANDKQFVGSFDRLAGVTKFNVTVDWSTYTINNLNEEEWLRFRDAEQPQWDATKELKDELKPRWLELVEEANKKLNKARTYLLADDHDQQYTIVIRPERLDKRGNQTDLVIIKDEKTGEELVKFRITGKGGIFGTMSNLWGDGFRSAGGNLAKILLKQLK